MMQCKYCGHNLTFSPSPAEGGIFWCGFCGSICYRYGYPREDVWDRPHIYTMVNALAKPS